MAHIQIQCQNCGAKYKIPEAFTGATAKCKQCGSAIDVASQRQAAADETPAAQPTGRRSARRSEAGCSSSRGARRSSRRRRGEEEQEEQAAAKPARAAGGPRGRGRRGEESDANTNGNGDDPGGRPRRQRKKDPTPIVVGAIIGGLAIVATVLIYTSWDKITEKVKLPGQEEKYAAAQKRKAEAAEKDRQERLEAMQAEHDRLAKDAADKAAAKKAKEAAAKKPKQEDQLKSKSDIYKPKEALQPLPLPESVAADQAKKINELLDTVLGAGGIHGIRAKNQLAGMGWVILVPTINRMRELNYTTIEGNRDGFVLDRLIKSVTGWESGFDPAIYEGEEFPLKTAHANAKIVRDLQLRTKGKAIWSTAENLKKWKKKNVR